MWDRLTTGLNLIANSILTGEITGISLQLCHEHVKLINH